MRFSDILLACLGGLLITVSCSRTSETEDGAITASAEDSETPPEVPMPDVSQVEEAPILGGLQEARVALESDPSSPESWGGYGEFLMAHDWPLEAAQCFREARKKDPDAFRWPYLEALCWLEFDAEKSLEALEVATRNRSDYAPAQIRLCQALARENRIEEALEHGEAALLLDPDSADAHLVLGQVLLQKTAASEDDLSRAITLLQEAQDNDPTHPEIHAALARAHGAAGDETLANKHADLARRHANRTGTPLKDPEGRPRSKPYGSRALTQFAEALAARQQHDKAVEAFRAALSVREDYEPAHRGLADSLARIGRGAEAIAALEKALEFSPDSSAIHTRLGKLHADQQEPAKAKEHYQRADELRPGDPDLLYRLAMVHQELGDDEEAARVLRRCLKTDESMAAGHFDLAKLCETLGPPEDVETHYLKAIDLMPDVIDAPLRLGLWYAQKGRVEESVLQFDTVLQNEPRNFQAWLTSGVVLAQAGRSGEAIPRLEEAYAIRPQDEKLKASLAGTCWAAACRHVGAGESEKAREDYERAVAVRPQWPIASSHLAWLLSTHPDSEIRDGNRAVALAESAQSEGAADDMLLLDALGVAYAEAGRFEEAIQYATEALLKAEAQNVRSRTEKIRARLDAFRRSIPHRTDGRQSLADG